MTDPYPFLCNDGARFTVTYIAQPVIPLLAYDGVIYVLRPHRTASGACFVMADELGQEGSFWNMGEEPLFEIPGEPKRNCQRMQGPGEGPGGGQRHWPRPCPLWATEGTEEAASQRSPTCRFC